jgi:hypothetical protein
MQDQVIKLVLDLKKELPTATSKDIAQTLAPDLNITDDQEIDDLATQIDGLNEEVLKKKEGSDPIQGLTDQPIGLGSGPTKSASLKPKTSIPSLQERASILNPDVEALNRAMQKSLDDLVVNANGKEGAMAGLSQIEQQYGVSFDDDQRANISDLATRNSEAREFNRKNRLTSAAFASSQEDLDKLLSQDGVTEQEKEQIMSAYDTASKIREQYTDEDEQIKRLVGAGLVDNRRAGKIIRQRQQREDQLKAVFSTAEGLLKDGKYDEALQSISSLSDIDWMSRKQKKNLSRELARYVSDSYVQSSVSSAFGELKEEDVDAVAQYYAATTGSGLGEAKEKVLQAVSSFEQDFQSQRIQQLFVSAELPASGINTQQEEVFLSKEISGLESLYEQLNDEAIDLDSGLYLGEGEWSFPQEERIKEVARSIEAKRAELASMRVNRERFISFANNKDNSMAISAMNIYRAAMPFVISENTPASRRDIFSSSDPLRTAFESSDEYQRLVREAGDKISTDEWSSKVKASFDEWSADFMKRNQDDLRSAILESLRFKFGGEVTQDNLERVEKDLSSFGIKIDLTGDDAIGYNRSVLSYFAFNPIPAAAIYAFGEDVVADVFQRPIESFISSTKDLFMSFSNVLKDAARQGTVTTEELRQRMRERTFLQETQSRYKEYEFGDGSYETMVESLSMASSSLPFTLAAIGATALTRNPSIGMGIVGIMEGSSIYNSYRSRPEFYSMTPLEKTTLIGGTAAVAALTERFLGDIKIADSLIGGGIARAIAQNPVEYGFQMAAKIGLNVSSDAAGEMITEGYTKFTEAAISGDYSFFHNEKEMLNTMGAVAASSVLVSGPFAAIGVARNNSTYKSLTRDGERDLRSIIKNTKPNTLERKAAVEQFIRDYSRNSYVLEDNKNFNDFISANNHSDLNRINSLQNRVAILENILAVTPTAESAEIISEMSEIQQEITAIEDKYSEAFLFSQSESGIDVSIASTERLIERERSRSRRLRGKEGNANAQRLRDSEEETSRLKEKLRALRTRKQELAVTPSETPKIDLSGTASPSSIDALKSQGYRVVSYRQDPGMEGKYFVVYDPRGKVKIDNSLPIPIRNAEADLQARSIAMRRNGETKMAIQEMIIESIVNGGQTTALTPTQQKVYTANKEQIDNAITSSRSDFDIAIESASEAVEISLDNEESIGQIKDKYGVLGDSVVRKMMSEFGINVVTAKDGVSMLKHAKGRSTGYASLEKSVRIGGTVIGAFDSSTNTIYLSEDATIKDVLEESLHAILYHKFKDNKPAKSLFINKLRQDLLSNKSLKYFMERKRSNYNVLGINELSVKEEEVVEAISIAIATKDAVAVKTVFDRIIDYVKSVFGIKDLGNDIVDSMDQLKVVKAFAEYLIENKEIDQAIADELSDIEDATATSIEEMIDDSDMALSYSGPASFLYNKEITYDERTVSKFGELTEVSDGRGLGKKKIVKDYADFRRWYNWMTNNGRTPIVTSMSYVDENGNVKRLNPPKPFFDKETGEISKPNNPRPIGWAAQQLKKNQLAQEQADKRRRDLAAASSYIGKIVSKHMPSVAAFQRSYKIDEEGIDERNKNLVDEPKILPGDSRHISLMYEALYDFLSEREDAGIMLSYHAEQASTPKQAMDDISEMYAASRKEKNESLKSKRIEALVDYIRSFGIRKDIATDYANGKATAAIVDSIRSRVSIYFSEKNYFIKGINEYAERVVSSRVVQSMLFHFGEQAIKERRTKSQSYLSQARSSFNDYINNSSPADFGGQAGYDFAKSNQNLWMIITAISSNGNTSYNNIVLSKYIAQSLSRIYAENGSISTDIPAVQALLTKIEHGGFYDNMPGRPDRFKFVSGQLRNILDAVQGNDKGGSYDAYLSDLAMNPGKSKKYKNNSQLMDVLSPKIGAWASNLIGNEKVVTQDSHFVQALNVFRGFSKPKIDWAGLADIIGDTAFGKLDTPQKRMSAVAAVLKDICDRKSVGKNSVFAGLSQKDLKRLKTWFNLNQREILQSKPKSDSERSFNENVAIRVAKQLSRALGTDITPAMVQQLIFEMNHDQRRSLGVSQSEYSTYESHITDRYTHESAQKIFGSQFRNVMDADTMERLESLEQYQTNDEGGFMFSFVPGESRTHGQDILSGPNGDALTPQNIDQILSPYPLHTAIRNQGSPPKENQRVFVYVDQKIMSETMYPVLNISKTLSGLPMFSSDRITLTDVSFPKPSSFTFADIVNGKGPKRHISGKNKEIKETDDIMTGVLITLDPTNNNGFADENGRLIKSADEVTVINGKIIARGNIEYYPDTMNKNGISTTAEFVQGPRRSQGKRKSIIEAVKENIAKYMPEIYTEEDDVIMSIYDRLSPEDQAAILISPSQKKGKIRGTASRAASSGEYSEIKDQILSNPANYIDTKYLEGSKKELEGKSVPELISMMRGDKLGSLMNRNDDVGVLAGIELINRLQAEGRTEAIPSVLEDLAKMGTSIGRLLRQFGELKTSTSFGIYGMISSLAESQGKVLTDDMKTKLQEAAENYMVSYRNYESLVDRAIAGEDLEAELKEAMNSYLEAQNKLDTMVNTLVDKSWSDIGIQLMQGNLLTSMSQAKNIAYNIAQMFPRTMVDVASYPIEKLLNAMGVKSPAKRISMAAYLYGLKKFGSGWVEAAEQVVTGKQRETTEWRMDRGFMPVRSLIAALSNDLPQTKSGRASLNSRAKLLVAGTFGIPAETMFRLLSLGDIPFRRYAEATELYHIGVGMGLKGEELARFLKYPSREAMDRAKDEGAKMTFQKEGGLARGSMWIISNLSRGLGKMFENSKGFDAPGFFKFFIRSNVPYVTTIANFMEESLTYISPAFGSARVAVNIMNGKADEAAKNATKVMVGQVFTQMSLQLIANGIISPGIDWEDDEKTNLMYDVMPPNSINVSALKRWLSGEDPAPRTDDVYKSYQTLGVLGSIMGAYAQSMTIDAAKDAIKEPTKGINILKRALGMENAALISYMMDQSFLQGLNGAFEIITESDPEKLNIAMEKYAESLFKAYSAMAIPNFFSGANMATREFMPDKRDADLSDRLINHVKERTFNTDGLPVKVNWKGERISQAPKGGRQFAYYMFDPYKTSTSGTDPVSIEILNLYMRTGELPKAIGTPYYASSVHRKLEVPSFSRGKAQKAMQNLMASGAKYEFVGNTPEDFRFSLTAEELNNILEMSNSLRYKDMQQFMQTDKFKGMSDSEKIEALDELNQKYNSMLEYLPDGSFMPHSKYLIQVIENKYLESR